MTNVNQVDKSCLQFTLPNLGNTCYLNTGLQCILNSSIFIEYLTISDFPEDSIFYHLQQTVHSIVNHSTQVKEVSLNFFSCNRETTPNQSYWNPHRQMVKYLGTKLQKHINIYRQNDLQEFLNLIIDHSNQELANSPKHNNVSSICEYKYNNIATTTTTTKPNQNSSFYRLQKKCDNAWNKHFKNEYSPIVPLFYSLLISQISCGCGKIHHNYEFFNSLQIDIVSEISEDDTMLTTCIDEFMKPFKLNQNNNDHNLGNLDNEIRWKCDVCKQQLESTKNFAFWRLPQILIIVLKRFVFDEKFGQFRKLNTVVDIPDIIDFKKWVLCKESTVLYELRTIGCHYGGLDSGHYYSLVRKGQNKWVKIDDDDASPQFNRHTESQYKPYFNDAYVCVYQKI